jgi:hypothetical protein
MIKLKSNKIIEQKNIKNEIITVSNKNISNPKIETKLHMKIKKLKKLLMINLIILKCLKRKHQNLNNYYW